MFAPSITRCLRFAVVLLTAVPGLQGCRHSQQASTTPPSASRIAMRHAERFTLEKRKGWIRLQVRKPWQGAETDFDYALIPSGSRPDDIPAGAARIAVPVRRVITMTTINLASLQEIGAADAVVGLGGGRYVCNPEFRARLRDGRIRNVGDDMQVDVEAVLGLAPDLVFAFAVGGRANAGVRKLRETGLPVAMEGSYMEESPLGRAEWMKFTAAFFGKGSQADSQFAAVEKAYDSLKALARGVAARPTVLVNAPFGGSWWIPGGRSYVARFIEDAGGRYLWADDTTRGALSLDLETVLGRAAEADFWLNPSDWRSLGEGKGRDPRMAFFKAFRAGRVYANDAMRCEGGGNDFFETGPTRPDLLLADVIALLHPELLPDHKLRWYRKLGEKP